jgi:type III restriction enzyme
LTADAAPFGIEPTNAEHLRRLFERTPGLRRVWIHGSRARGDHRTRSDIDLVLDAPAFDSAQALAVAQAVKALPIVYAVDCAWWQDPGLGERFRTEVQAERRVFWEPAPRAARVDTAGAIELKDYQRKVLNQLGAYLEELRRQRAQTEAQAQALRAMEGAEATLRDLADYPRRAWDALRRAGALPPLLKGQSPAHHSRWDGAGRAIPNVCLKVPTGGGKTLLAAAAVGQILQGWLRRSTGLVLWVVPNEAIYRQTLAALSHRDHPYRQLLNVAGAGRVKVLEKSHPLTRQDVEGQLCVMLLMLAGANRRNKETLKFFADSGRVAGFLPREDDLPAHHDLLRAVPNLDAYRSQGRTADEARAQLGSVVKSSLGNVMRLVRPVVVIDEGHHAYSEGALQTLDGFNPSFMLELSATPRLAAAKKGASAGGSNVLASVNGRDLEAEDMIKMPIHVDVRGWSDWRACLGAALERLDTLQREAEGLQGETARYIRPILLVQVERTGAEHRDAGWIHAEDAREHLLALGLTPRQIAVKTSEVNDLSAPENIDLLSPTCEVRAIITKQALQEGWDCPFAYVLCALAAGRNLAAMTQLVGRVLRQPQVTKTGRPALDACWVLCHDAGTGEVVAAIKQSLEQEGMGDLGLTVSGDGGPGGDAVAAQRVVLRRRPGLESVRLFVPRVAWVEEDGSRRALDYDSDVLAALPWHALDAGRLAAQWAPDASAAPLGHLAIGLDILERGHTAAVQDGAADPERVDRARLVRSLLDIAPNPWWVWAWVDAVLSRLLAGGLAERAIARSTATLVERLRADLEAARDAMAEAEFGRLLAGGRIEFRLRADRVDYELPFDDSVEPAAAPVPLACRSDGQPVQKTLLVPALAAPELNAFELRVAGYLDQQAAVEWWHRNVARTQVGLQGWKRHKVYPDFIFAMRAGAQRRMVLLETKGLHLQGQDTQYKQALLERLTQAFADARGQRIGALELHSAQADTVVCDLVFDEAWQGVLAQRHFSG